MPFFRTGMLGSDGQGPNSSGENIGHITAVRMRVVGSGNLDMRLYSTDDVTSSDLVAFAMSAATNIQPTRLANFIEQRASLKCSTDEIDEWFRINRIIIYVREFGSSYPG